MKNIKKRIIIPLRYKPTEVIAGVFDGVEKKVSELTVAELRQTICEAFYFLDRVDDADVREISAVVTEISNWLAI